MAKNLEVRQRLDVDVTKPVEDIFYSVQNDTKTRFIDVKMYQNGVTIDLTGVTARIYCIKYDGKEVFDDGKIENAEEGRVLFEITNQMSIYPNALQCQIKLFDDNDMQILSSQIFNIFISKDLFDEEALESTNEYGSLIILFKQIYDVRVQINEINDKIGVVGETGNRIEKDTVFEQLEYLIEQNENASVSSLKNILDQIKNMVSKIYNTPKVVKRVYSMRIYEATTIAGDTPPPNKIPDYDYLDFVIKDNSWKWNNDHRKFFRDASIGIPLPTSISNNSVVLGNYINSNSDYITFFGQVRNNKLYVHFDAQTRFVCTYITEFY